MTKYRKKPVIIEAEKFNGTNHDAIADFCAPQPIKVGGGYTLLIPRIEGREMTVHKGEWIIKDENGEFDSCEPDIFVATYEPF